MARSRPAAVSSPISSLRSLLLVPLLSGVLGACGDAPADNNPPPGASDDGANPDPRCQPLAPIDSASPTSCALPFPSSFYLTTDTTTATGLRVNFPAGLLPRNTRKMEFDSARLNQLDGFSPASQILADLGVRDRKSVV